MLSHSILAVPIVWQSRQVNQQELVDKANANIHHTFLNPLGWVLVLQVRTSSLTKCFEAAIVTLCNEHALLVDST